MKTFTIVSFGSDLQKLGRELQYIQVENQIVKIITNDKVKSRLLCKMLYNVFTISTYQN